MIEKHVYNADTGEFIAKQFFYEPPTPDVLAATLANLTAVHVDIVRGRAHVKHVNTVRRLTQRPDPQEILAERSVVAKGISVAVQILGAVLGSDKLGPPQPLPAEIDAKIAAALEDNPARVVVFDHTESAIGWHEPEHLPAVAEAEAERDAALAAIPKYEAALRTEWRDPSPTGA